MLILIGESCCGKTSIQEVLESEYGMNRLITYTTREPRKGEKNGVSYNFISQSDFDKMSDEFIESTSYRDCSYGSFIKEDEDIDRVVAVLTPEGAYQYIERYPGEVYVAHITTDKETRAMILLKRGVSYLDMIKQIDKDSQLFSVSELDRLVGNRHQFVNIQHKYSKEKMAKDIFNMYAFFLNSNK